MYLNKARKEAEAVLTPVQISAIFDNPENPNPFVDKRVLELYLIRPEEDLPSGGLEFRPFVMAQMMARGRSASERALNQVPLLV